VNTKTFLPPAERAGWWVTDVFGFARDEISDVYVSF